MAHRTRKEIIEDIKRILLSYRELKVSILMRKANITTKQFYDIAKTNLFKIHPVKTYKLVSLNFA